MPILRNKFKLKPDDRLYDNVGLKNLSIWADCINEEMVAENSSHTFHQYKVILKESYYL